MSIEISTRQHRNALVAVGLCIVLCGLVAEVSHALADIHQYDAVLFFFSLSYEQNLPTWYSSMLLACSGLALWQQAQVAESYNLHWRAMAFGLFLASIDETAELHENLGGLIGTSGLLYFDWIIPATLVMTALAIIYVPFTRHLPAQTRRAFLLAGAIYLGGALVMELPLGYWTEAHGVSNLGYALIDWVEETLEILGASLFLLAVLANNSKR